MKTLSNTYHGKVYKTTSNAFNLSKVRTELEKLILLNGGETYGHSVAKTGSIYFDAELKGFCFQVRIANHSKRVNCIFEIAEPVKVDEMFNYSVDLNILNPSSKEVVFNYISSLIAA